MESWMHNPETWVAVAFVVFLGVAAKYVWPPIAKALDARAAKIGDQLEQAAKLKAEAEALLKTYEKQRKEARKEAEEIVAAARRDADSIRTRAAAELRDSLARRSAQAAEQIARAEADATRGIRARLIDLATEAARDVITSQLAQAKDDPAIQRAIAGIERQLH
ncbi:MAG: F0F1 ATP synthase subunit B [Alphaproteobacteria bacterium]